MKSEVQGAVKSVTAKFSVRSVEFKVWSVKCKV